MKTIGISPKLLADLFASVAGYALTKYGVGLDPTLSAIIGKTIGSVAAYIAGPGVVGDLLDAPPAPDEIDKAHGEVMP